MNFLESIESTAKFPSLGLSEELTRGGTCDYILAASVVTGSHGSLSSFLFPSPLRLSFAVPSLIVSALVRDGSRRDGLQERPGDGWGMGPKLPG